MGAWRWAVETRVTAEAARGQSHWQRGKPTQWQPMTGGRSGQLSDRLWDGKLLTGKRLEAAEVRANVFNESTSGGVVGDFV